MTLWKVEFNNLAERDMMALDREVRLRIYRFFHERVEKLEDPKVIAEPLTGELRGLWRFRIGDYRAICDIQQRKLTVLVLQVAHRSVIYKSHRNLAKEQD